MSWIKLIWKELPASVWVNSWFKVLISAFPKQLLIPLVRATFHDERKVFMATRIKTVDKKIILINALNNSATLTLVFKLLITPWSIGWTFDNFKQLVEADFSTTNSWSSYFVKWLSLFLPPEHFSDPKLNLLSGRHRKKSTNWSAVNECFNSFFQRMARCTVSDHGVVIKFSTYLLSTPNVIWKKTIYL